MRKAFVLFVENKLEECQSNGDMLQLNEIARKRILPHLHTNSIKYLKSS